MEMGDTKIGFITCGIAYHYIKEICPDASILKLGLVNPLPKKMIQEFASKVDKLYIFEELEPVIEEQVKSWGIQAIGKEVFTRQGEYSSTMLAKVLEAAGELPSVEAVREAAQVPARPPILCPGCPHRSVFSVLNKLKIHGAGDIGCYTLGAVAPLSVIDTTVCMGASISTLHGMEKAKGKDYIKNWVAVIGDSTFMHTGINSLMNMVYNQSTGTVIILDNSTTGMTGHQDHAATGKTLMGQTVPAINIMGLCKSLGIASVTEVNAFDLPELTRLIKEETAKDSLSVIITKSPCVLLKGVSFPNKCVVLSDPPSEEAIAKAQEAAANLQETAAKPQEAAASPKESSTTSFTTDGPTSVYAAPVSRCKKCGACLRPGCPALTKKGDGTVTIDKTMCNGCGLCMQLCPFGAIGLVSKEEGGALA
jgi:indolepyruvate ferredoxin oxidoreductase alpha subunit